VYVVDDLGLELLALVLLGGADEVPVRALLAVGERELPVFVRVSAGVLSGRAGGANHGRRGACDHSTLAEDGARHDDEKE
jgi:hypothetical protein